MMPQPPTIPTHWALIVAGVVCVVVGIFILRNNDDPNARGGFKEALGGVWVIALGVVFSWVGLAGLNAQEADPGAADQKAAQKAYAKGVGFFSAWAKFEEVATLFLSILWLIGFIFFTVSELRNPSENRKRNIVGGVIITLICGAVILVNWWLRF